MSRTGTLRAPIALLCATMLLPACSGQSRHALAVATAAAADETPQPLAEVRASSATGEAVFGDRDAGNCVLCHRVTGLDVPFQGDVGPDLSTVGARLSPAQLRYRIIDASRLNPATVMPPYFRTHGLNRVAPDYADRTVLSGEQIEHLVAYLSSLTAPPP